MIFKRRDRPPTHIRLREVMVPRKGWWRGFDYVHKRMRRLPDSPHRIALGFACGAFASFTPFFGLHFLLAAAFAWVVRANIVAALLGTAVGNPFTFPFISATALWLGRWLMRLGEEERDFEEVTHDFAEGLNSIWGTIKNWFGLGPSTRDGLSEFFHEIFLPYLIGGIPPGVLAGVICYFVIGPLVAAYQERRRRRLLMAQARHRARLDAETDAYRDPDRGEGDNA